MINKSFYTLVYREVWRFLVLYKQTIMPGIITAALYMVIFGEALGSRIKLENNIDYIIRIAHTLAYKLKNNGKTIPDKYTKYNLLVFNIY